MAKKLWGGRFKKPMDPALKEFSYSLSSDIYLLFAEMDVNKAWVKMLKKSKLITASESQKLIKGLVQVEKTILNSDFDELIDTYEDIHSCIQQLLEKKIGAVGKKLHTARSRNDLVVTSTRIYLREKVTDLSLEITKCQKGIIALAKKAQDSVIAGMTHLRKAQPVLAAHHLLAYVEMLEEDKDRLKDTLKRIDVMPLGSAALAGSALALDRSFLAKELGFSKISRNSMASVSDRGFISEVLSVLAIMWMHLSRLSEDFILWNSEAFGYIELDDAFSTGSSLMPQKKNPDVFELIRGRSGIIFGHLNSILVIQKGLALAYNRDLQEDKPGLFESIMLSEGALDLLAKTVKTATFNFENMKKSVDDEDTLYATDLLEYLVAKKIPFASAHEIVGKVVRYGSENRTLLRNIPIDAWKKFSSKFDKDIFRLFEPSASVNAKKTVGSTNPKKVQSEIKAWSKRLN